MIPERRIPTHPGEVLREEYLVPLGITQVALADHLDIPLQRINEIVRGRRGVSPETAWLLAGALDTTPEFWVNLQAMHDLARTRPTRTIRRIPKTA
jgi:addiction module HigA family antidote